MKTLRAGNRTVLNQQCAEGNTTIEEKTAGPTPTTGSVWQLPYYVLLYGLPQPKYFFCKDSEALRGHKIFSLNRLKNCPLPNTFWVGVLRVDIFHQLRRPKNEYCRAHRQRNKKKKQVWGDITPKKKGFHIWFFVILDIYDVLLKLAIFVPFIKTNSKLAL